MSCELHPTPSPRMDFQEETSSWNIHSLPWGEGSCPPCPVTPSGTTGGGRWPACQQAAADRLPLLAKRWSNAGALRLSIAIFITAIFTIVIITVIKPFQPYCSTGQMCSLIQLLIIL